MPSKEEYLGEILVRKGYINNKQLQEALIIQKGSKDFLGKILLQLNYLCEKDLLEALSEQFSVEVVNLQYQYIDWKFVSKFSPSLIVDHRCMPIRQDDWSVTVAVTNPLDTWALKRAEDEAGGFKLRLVLVTENDMNEAIARYQKFIRSKYF